MKQENRVKNPLSKSIIIGGSIFTLIFVLAIGSLSYLTFNHRMMQLYTEHITGIMELTLARIDTDDLRKCIETKEPTEGFFELMNYLDQSRTYYNMDTCTIVYPYEENGEYKVMQVVSGLTPAERYGSDRKEIPLPLLGDDLTPYLAPGFPETIYNDFLTRYDIKYSKERNAFGDNYYAAKTIRDENNKPVAVLTTSASLKEIENTVRNYMIVSTAGILGLALLFMFVMIGWLRKRIINPLRLMGEVADDFEKKSHDQKNPDALIMENKSIHTGDEMEALANTLVAMSTNIKTYVEELIQTAITMENMKVEVSRANELAMRDSLTGVKSKAAYDQQRDRLNLDIQAGDAEFGIAMIDINYLKKINDTYGHEKGNIYIKKMCTMICDAFAHSPVFRVGGDEFVAVLIHRDYENREELVQVLKDKMNEQAAKADVDEWLKPTAAIGIGIYDPKIDKDCDTVLKRADEAMYENKKAMKACRKE